MSDKIINFIRILVEDGAEVTYKSEDGYEMISEYKSELIARIKEEKK